MSFCPVGEHVKIILKEHARVFICFLLQKKFCRPTLYKNPSTSLHVQHITPKPSHSVKAPREETPSRRTPLTQKNHPVRRPAGQGVTSPSNAPMAAAFPQNKAQDGSTGATSAAGPRPLTPRGVGPGGSSVGLELQLRNCCGAAAKATPWKLGLSFLRSHRELSHFPPPKVAVCLVGFFRPERRTRAR